MRRGALIDEIQRLERALIGDESGARGEAETRAAKLDIAIERLESVALSLERQLVTIDGVGEFSPADELLFVEERKSLSARITRLRDKIEQLQVSRPMVEVSPTLGRPKGIAHELRGRLAELVKQLRNDPHVSRADVRPFQLRLVELVRDRRRRLEEASERLHDSRDYLLHCAQRLDGLAHSAAAMQDDAVDEPADTPVDTPANISGVDSTIIDTPEPAAARTAPDANCFLGDRAALATRVEMAHLALDDALDVVRLLAHDWPELASIADQPDWDRLPFAAVRAELSTARSPRTPTSAALVQHFQETKQLCETLALWVGELHSAVSSAPPPVT
ncbi:MAG: hypothetical protein ACI81R_002067 [Bradymonadia bacterium]|jgi:hypothetical protein